MKYNVIIIKEVKMNKRKQCYACGDIGNDHRQAEIERNEREANTI